MNEENKEGNKKRERDLKVNKLIRLSRFSKDEMKEGKIRHRQDEGSRTRSK